MHLETLKKRRDFVKMSHKGHKFVAKTFILQMLEQACLPHAGGSSVLSLTNHGQPPCKNPVNLASETPGKAPSEATCSRQTRTTLDAAPGQSHHLSRFCYGITASRKLGKAVQRNRAKRRLRAVIREVLPAHGKGGYAYVMIARPPVLEQEFSQICKDFRRALVVLHRKFGTPNA